MLPGENGQIVVLGHSAPPGWPHIKHDWVFKDISKLQTGDQIILYFNNKQYIYNVISKDIINKVDFLVDRTVGGQVTVDYSVSSSNDSILTSNNLTNTIIGTSILETSPYSSIPLESFQERLWHPIYMWAEGECIQLNIYMNDTQMRNLDLVSFSDFVLHAMTFYTQPTSSRLQ